MRKFEIKESDCNCCGRKCGGDIVRGKRGEIKQHLSCPGWLLPYPMRSSLLERASEHEGTWSALNVILESLNLTFHETSRYPYFIFKPSD